jgi:branched-chain amino acid transport system ATP-binding protein
MSGLLEIAGLSRAFGGLHAVSGLGFDVAPGEILGLIGPNGAGKTTVVNLISGVLRPSAGRIRFDGADVTRLPAHLRAARGLVRTFQATTVYAGETVRENALRGAFLQLYPGLARAFLGGGRQREMRRRAGEAVDRLLQWLDLDRVAGVRAGELPYGYQKTVGIVVALAAEPRLLMLDEPVAGLGGEEADHVRDAIRRVRERGIAVVVIDHNMRFIAGLCDRIVVMHHGQLLAEGAPGEVLGHPGVVEAYLGKRHAAPRDR